MRTEHPSKCKRRGRATLLTPALKKRICAMLERGHTIMDSDDWRAKAWYLERTDPEQYARTEERPIVIQSPPVRDDTADYGTTAATLRIILAGTHDEAKREALRLALAIAVEEDAKLSNLIEHWRTDGLLS